MRRSYLETPGRGGGRQAAPFKDFRPPSPSGGRALCASFVEMSVPVPAALHPQSAQPPATSALMLVSEERRCSWAQSATTRTVINMRRSGARWQPQCCASNPPPYAPPVLGRLSQLLLLPGQATSRRVTACGSKVRSACLSPAAIPPGLSVLPQSLRSHGCCASRVTSALLQHGKAFRAARMQPSRLLAQTVSSIADPFDSLRSRPESALPATDCAG